MKTVTESLTVGLEIVAIDECVMDSDIHETTLTLGKSYTVQQTDASYYIIDDEDEIHEFGSEWDDYFKLPKTSSDNRGGSTDYYKLQEGWKDCADIMESRNMNYNQGNIMKSAFCFNAQRHSGTDYERELNKIIYFANRELNLLKKDKNGI